MPGNYPEESIQHSEHGKSLKSRIGSCLLICQVNSQMANYKEQNIREKIKKDTKQDTHASDTHKTNIMMN
jgi:hypothetical protein